MNKLKIIRPNKNDALIHFQLLEEKITTFMKKELQKFLSLLGPDYPQCLAVLDRKEEEQNREVKERFLRMALHFLMEMNRAELAERLQSSKTFSNVLTSDLRPRPPGNLFLSWFRIFCSGLPSAVQM